MRKTIVVCDVCGTESPSISQFYHIDAPDLGYANARLWGAYDICPDCWKRFVALCSKKRSEQEEQKIADL